MCFRELLKASFGLHWKTRICQWNTKEAPSFRKFFKSGGTNTIRCFGRTRQYRRPAIGLARSLFSNALFHLFWCNSSYINWDHSSVGQDMRILQYDDVASRVTSNLFRLLIFCSPNLWLNALRLMNIFTWKLKKTVPRNAQIKPHIV